MKGLFTFIIILIWVLIGVFNMLKKRSESMQRPQPRERPRPPVPPQRPVRPQPRRPTAPSVFAPKRQAVPGPREAPVPSRPTQLQTIAQALEEMIASPRRDVREREIAAPRPRPRPKKVRPRPTYRPPERIVRRPVSETPRERFQFSDKPIINGIIFSELLGPPIAKRPFYRRRIF